MNADKATKSKDSGEITLYVKTLTAKTLTLYIDVSSTI